ncbi:MAG: DNA polymerase IV [Candidatus Omnitrophica bacterium]|jgi:nucleotidyltransferase/DNA polymerase involved in DNA repair|nr:DNA polymerase IV [Candidatus Omnitrophota bacterium]
MPTNRYIVHVDMDAFFAAIEQRDNPSYKDKPVVVGADPKGGRGRGVVSTCSYEARKFGIHSSLPISTAYSLCPQAIFLPVNMEKYSVVSRQIHNILDAFTPSIEMVSIDEAFLDIAGSFHLFGTPLTTCELIKEKIKKETGLTASLGLAPTKMAAKIASDICKPDGLLEITSEKLLDFLWPLPIEKISGLGKRSKEILNERGIRTIKGLAKQKKDYLVSIFGKSGEYFWRLANGIDEAEVIGRGQAKSISSETTFEKDTADEELIRRTFLMLCEDVSGRLRSDRLKARTVTLKVRLTGFKTYTRALTIQKATNFVDEIYKATRVIYNKFISSEVKGASKIRLIGIKVSNLMPQDERDSLFDEKIDQKKENMHKAVEVIKGKFGNKGIFRAAEID